MIEGNTSTTTISEEKRNKGERRRIRSKTVLFDPKEKYPTELPPQLDIFQVWRRSNRRFHTISYLDIDSNKYNNSNNLHRGMKFDPIPKINNNKENIDDTYIESHSGNKESNDDNSLLSVNTSQIIDSDRSSNEIHLIKKILPIDKQQTKNILLKYNDPIVSVHKPLKELINKTYQDFYNIDANKIHYKAGLSKKTIASLPSLHPEIKRNQKTK